MKLLVNLCRFIVGLLFIFSGLIKANDPLGLAYKMQEFFEIWSSGLSQGSFFLKNGLIHLFSFLHEHSLFLAVVMIAFEIIAGVALLLGWRMRLFSWLLLLLIIFFTFLTGYAYLSGKFRNCGCFGDCLPITPLTSFSKDVVLTILILFLFANRKRIQPLFRDSIAAWFMLIITLLSVGLQLYMLNYLPALDCLPYKKGKNIAEEMKMPADAIPDSTVITFVYARNGKQVEFTADKFPADFDSSYKFVSRYDKMIRPGKNNEPPIKGFVLTGTSGADSTTTVLLQPYAVLLYWENFDRPVARWKNAISDVYTTAKQKNIPVYVVTSQVEEAIKVIAQTPMAGVQIFSCDNTAVRTAARTSPCIYLLKSGTVLDKQSFHGSDKIKNALAGFPAQPVKAETTTIDSTNTSITK